MVKIGIIEGIDKVGKTTLIKHMQNIDPKIQVRKTLTDPTDMTTSRILDIADEHIRSWSEAPKDATIIYDRFPYPSEFVYRFTRDGHEGLNRSYCMDLIEHSLKEFDVSYIYIEPAKPWDYMKRVAEDPDPLFETHKPDVLFGMLKRYAEWIQTTKLPVMKNILLYVPDYRLAQRALKFIQLGTPRVNVKASSSFNLAL
jgi:hypothetical protein